ncbi:MAG: hypothetical protein IKF96_01020, partial [Eggerthellaceae bacterium]|nr:hypothetical protein [Eggerthellaceae bacterium]
RQRPLRALQAAPAEIATQEPALGASSLKKQPVAHLMGECARKPVDRKQDKVPGNLSCFFG